VYVDLKSLLEFLKILNKKRGKGAFFSELEIFDIFEQSGAIKSAYSNYDPNFKVMFYINTKFMIEPEAFLEKYSKELKFNENERDVRIVRCQECHSILPNNLILEKNINNYIIKPFQQKVKEHYLSVFSNTIKHQNFVDKSGIETIKDLYDKLKGLYEELVRT
jgi:hypothetical protein